MGGLSRFIQERLWIPIRQDAQKERREISLPHVLEAQKIGLKLADLLGGRV